MIYLNTRDEFLDVLPKNMRTAELGVFNGDFSEKILSKTNPSELYLIDPWIGECGSGDKDGLNYKFIKDMKAKYEELKDKYSSDERVFVKRQASFEFLNSMPDNYFDMIYIDGDHSYSSVVSDLTLSFLKLKNNAILSGHDYVDGWEPFAAVNDFCKMYKQNISLLTKDGCPTFYIKIIK